MADFTETLPNANSSRRIIDPGKDGPSWFEGIADVVSQGVQRTARLMDENAADSRQRAQAARQAREDADKAREKDVADRVAGVLWGTRDRMAAGSGEMPLAENQNDYPTYTPIDSSLEGPGALNPDTQAAIAPVVSELRRSQAAEDQGRAPQGSSRIVMERNLSALMAEFPDQRAEILAQLRTEGFNHYLFREMETEQKLHEANVDQSIKQRNAYADEAIAVGAVPVGTDPTVAAAVGQRIAAEKESARIAQAQAEAARAGSSEERTQFEFNEKRRSEESRRNFTANLSAVIQPLWTQLTNLMSQNHGEAMTLLPDAIRGMDVIVENHIAAARQNGVQEETINAMRADWENQKKAAIGFVSGPESDTAVAKTALEGIQTRLQMSLTEALPTYMALQEVFGATALADILGPNGNVSQEMIDDAKRELRGISGAIDTDSERVSLATTAQILRGNLQINQLSESQARAQMPVLVTSLNGLAREVNAGTGNVQSYTNGSLQVINAVMELQPGNQSVGSEISAAHNALGDTHRRAHIRIAREDPETGQLLVRSGRAAATKLLQNFQGHQLTPQERGSGEAWEVKYDQIRGYYYAAFNANRYRQTSGGSNPAAVGSGGIPMGVMARSTNISAEEAQQRGPSQAMRNLILGQNDALNYLAYTTEFDPDFQGVNLQEARDFYTTGRVPTAMGVRQTREREQRTTFQEQSQQFRQGLDEDRVASEQLRANSVSARLVAETPLPTSEVQRKVHAAADSFGLPWNLVGRLVGKESGWRTNASNGTTGAAGLFQINDDVQRSLDENIQHGLGMLRDAQQDAQRILGSRATDADTYVMYQQGSGGGAALLNPANASRKAEDVLKAVYGNAATARQAITANGGNLNMTAAEFAQSIRNYFNR